MQETETTRAILEALATQVQRHLDHGGALPRLALTFQVGTDVVTTLLVDGKARLIDSGAAPPGVPAAMLGLSHEALRKLMTGAVDASMLLRSGALRVAGRLDLVPWLSRCFPGAKDWLSVRLGR